MAPVSPQSHSKDSHAKDFTRVLPFHLSTSILGFLDQKSLDACSAVNGRWGFLVRQLREDRQCRGTVQRSLLQLKESCPRRTIPNYAKRVDVQIPQLNDEGEVIEVKEKEQKKRRKSKTEDFSLHEAYRDLKTDKVELEERNVFCGPYKTRVLTEQWDSRRRAHYAGGAWVAAAQRGLRLLSASGQEGPLLLLPRLAGPCRALCLRQDWGLLLCSTGWDLSIRGWDVRSGACVRTFSGHYAAVTCLHSHQEHLASGAEDGQVKVWSLESGRCLRTLMHCSPVWAVRMDGSHVVSGGHRGLVKVWSAETGALIKTLERHQGPVLCLSFDQWHLVTGSSDGYALGWSMLGKFRRCLIAFFHPKEVLSLEFLYLRVITGCADGHIRIFSFLSGTCLRVLEPSSSGGPISALCVAGNRVVTNSPSRLLLLQFEAVLWDYSLPADTEGLRKDKKAPKGKRQGSSAEQQRAQDTSPRPRQPPKSRGRAQSEEAKQSPAPPAPEEAEAAVEYELPQTDPSRAMCPDKFLLTISTLQSSCRAAPGTTPGLSADTRGAQQQHLGKVSLSQTALQQHLGKVSLSLVQQQQQHLGKVSLSLLQQQQQHLGKVSLSQTALQQHLGKVSLSQTALQQHLGKVSLSLLQQQQQQLGKVSLSLLQQQHLGKVSLSLLQQQQQQAAQLQHARLHSQSLPMTRISTPFETKMLQLRLRNSLHSPAVKSSIPAPRLVRPEFCGSERKTPGGHGKDTAGPKDGDQLIDLCTISASLELGQPTPGPAAQSSAAPGRIKPLCPPASRRDSGFRLLTAEQEACEAAVAAQHQAQQAKPTGDKERARRKAWLRKMRGLPVDSFTGERKTPAPELGHNTFI